MFPHAYDPADSTARSLRSAIRNAADLAVAFMTLESYGLDDLRPFSGAGAPRLPTDDATARAVPSPIDRAAASPEHPLGQPDLLAQHSPGRQHPHRHKLRASKRLGRPGAGAPREQLCLTPIRRSRAPSLTASEPPRWSTTPRHAPHPH